MQFKSVSYWLSCLGRKGFASAFFFGIALASIFNTSAQAAITVVPVDSSGVVLSNNASGTSVFYYPAGPYADDISDPPIYFRDTSDSSIPSVINVISGQASASIFNRNELVYFTFNSSNKGVVAPIGGNIVVFVTAQGTNGEKPVPIAFAGDAAGHGGLCPTVTGCLSQNVNPDNEFSYYFSYRYTPGATVMLGIFPMDVCINYTKYYGGTARGCGGTDGNSPGEVKVNETNVADAMQLNFYVTTLTADGKNGGSPGLTAMLSNPAPADKTTSVTSLVFERITIPPSMNCPSLVDVYMPGDSQIILDASRFSKAARDLVAPVTHLLVVGNDGASPLISTTLNIGNSIAARVGLGLNEKITGFTNTTDGSDHFHNLSFMVRDAAGIVVSGQGACALPAGVQTSQVQGFLAKGSCFIATAAYRSYDVPPVRMLRHFRDRILMNSISGRAFVRWYYHWSPDAAQWLMGHPSFRYPVLIALIPVEIVAWVLLYPVWAGLILILIIALKLRYLSRMSTAWIALFVCMLTVSHLSWGSQTGSETNSKQPFIDEIRKTLPPEQNSSESYIDSVLKKIPDRSSEGSYIENLKKEHPEKFTKSSLDTQWLEEKRNELPPKEEGGAILALQEGRSELHPRMPGDIRYAFGLRYGASLVRDVTAVPGAMIRPFDELYGSHYVPEFSLFFEYQFLRHERFASLGILGGVGLAYFHGQGTLKVNLAKPWAPGESFGQGAKTQFQFYAVPVTAALTYRMNLLNYLRPFVMAGPTGIFYMETRNDGQNGKHGYSKALSTSAGVSVLMDWLSSRDAWDSYRGSGIRHSYLTAEYSKVFALDSDVDFVASGIWAGVIFEY